jgi:predicted O-linked N-acetylglucosamine transferase (SPINDLY family)
VIGFLHDKGIDAERLEIVGRCSVEKYFKTYDRIDVALDPFPYTGGTTTCDALWMGVPVVTLAGRTAVGRSGVSLLSNVGLPELIAQTPEQYVQIAVDLAKDLPRLIQLRSTLRQRMEKSPLMDAAAFAKGIEGAYRMMWRKWCGETGSLE